MHESLMPNEPWMEETEELLVAGTLFLVALALRKLAFDFTWSIPHYPYQGHSPKSVSHTLTPRTVWLLCALEVFYNSISKQVSEMWCHQDQNDNLVYSTHICWERVMSHVVRCQENKKKQFLPLGSHSHRWGLIVLQQINSNTHRWRSSEK